MLMGVAMVAVEAWGVPLQVGVGVEVDSVEAVGDGAAQGFLRLQTHKIHPNHFWEKVLSAHLSPEEEEDPIWLPMLRM